jgi:2-aminomuconate deaminase
VSGASSRQPDNTIVGATSAIDGTVTFDIAQQTRAVLATIDRYLVAAGATLADLVDLTTFLVDMVDFDGYNSVYNEVFTAAGSAPARTTVAVHELPHPHLRIEIKATAYLQPDLP